MKIVHTNMKRGYMECAAIMERMDGFYVGYYHRTYFRCVDEYSGRV